MTPIWEEKGSLLFETAGEWRRVDAAFGTSRPAPAPQPTSDPELQTWVRGGYIAEIPVPEVLSPDGQWRASICDSNIVLRSSGNDQSRILTSDGTPDLSWDIEAVRYRTLPGLEVSTILTSPWHPDSQTLFACRRDISGVFRIPRIHWLTEFEEVDFTPFEKAGARIDRYQPYLVDIGSGLATRIDVGDVEERYVQLLGWRPDGAEVLIVSYSRDMTEATIIAADGQTGAARELMRESSRTFIRLQHETLMSGAHGLSFLPDSQGFLWLSTRDGWNHIYRYDNDGQLVGQLTSGDWLVYDIEAVAEDFVYFTAAIDHARPYDVHVCRVPITGGEVERLSEATGVHRPIFAPNLGTFLDTHSAVDRPVSAEIVSADGSTRTTLATMDISRLEAAGYREPEEFTVKAADGVTDLWGVMYKPADFDPARKYPVVEHIYGGPQIIATARHFSVFDRPARNLAWALAQLGFIVVSLDARGTPGRSKAFQDVVYGSWGLHEMADHAAAVRQLCEVNSWMDAERVGIIGHSWGGYFSTAALIQAPDLYKAAVSSSPGYIPRESILYEPYLGLPSTNAKAYDRADLTAQAAQLQGALLLVAGTAEYGPIGDAMKMSRALIDAGIQHEFAVLPGEHHSYAGEAETYFISKAAAFLKQHLMSGSEA